MKRTVWAIQHSCVNRLDGCRTWLEGCAVGPVRTLLFETRKEARTYAKERYGYLRKRLDLRAEPYGWRMPQVVRGLVMVEVVK